MAGKTASANAPTPAAAASISELRCQAGAPPAGPGSLLAVNRRTIELTKVKSSEVAVGHTATRAPFSVSSFNSPTSSPRFLAGRTSSSSASTRASTGIDVVRTLRPASVTFKA